VGALAGAAPTGCGVGASGADGTDPALPASQQEALQVARNSAAVHRDIADLIQFIGQGLAPNLGGSGPFGGSEFPSGIGPGGPTSSPAAGGGTSRIVLSPPASCSVTTQAPDGQLTLHDDCTLLSGRRISGALSPGYGGTCRFNGMQLSIDVTLGPAPGQADSLHLKGTLGLSFQATRLYASSSLDFDASFVGHTLVDTARDCLVIDLTARAFAFAGAANHALDGTVLLLATATDVQQSLCEPAPYGGQFRIARAGGSVQVTFSQPDPATELVEIDENGAAHQVRLPAATAAGCAPPASPLQLDYAICGSCAPPPPPTGPVLH